MDCPAGCRPGIVTGCGPFAAPPARVLVVEDFALLREMLTDGLTRAGFAVGTAGSVQEALDLQPEAYDVLLVDHRLGDALGTDLFRILSDGDDTVGSRFILMTAEARDLDLPMEVPVLLKPFRIDVLIDAVRRIHRGPGTRQDDARTGNG